ncbi:MAG TPA: tryptophan synthase subunit alpha [Pseudomonadales bacterium]
MSRIASCFARLKQQQRKALVPYVVAGDPDPATTVPLMHSMVEAGADVIELGVPFSDPMAEGPVIQLAHERALAHAVSLRQTLAMVAEFRRQDNTTPVVLMGYANPVEAMGYQAFAGEAAAAGVDGVLTVDLPPEEASDFHAALKQQGLDNIFLIAPTTTDERIGLIAAMATGYLYYVSLKGVTGAANLDFDSVTEKMAAIKAVTDLPVCVGFGIKDAESAQRIARLADGAVVGSALIAKMCGAENREAALQAAVPFLSSLREAMDHC